MTRPFLDHVAHVKEMGAYCKPGARVIVAGSGRKGTVVRCASANLEPVE